MKKYNKIMNDLNFIIFIILVISISILIIALFNIRRKSNRTTSQQYFIIILLLICLIIIPFYDLLQLTGYLAAIILEKSFPTIYGTFIAFLFGNLSIYGIHIFGKSIKYKTAERYRNRVIYTDFYTKMRHPLYASYHIIGLAYEGTMGSITGVIFITVIMILLYFDAKRLELIYLNSKHRADYQFYMENVKKRIYSLNVLIIIISMYAALVIGIIGILFIRI
ncbi:MAG: hypothetical protein ACP6IY_10640 [Promethearchaeia archaeon]